MALRLSVVLSPGSVFLVAAAFSTSFGAGCGSELVVDDAAFAAHRSGDAAIAPRNGGGSGGRTGSTSVISDAASPSGGVPTPRGSAPLGGTSPFYAMPMLGGRVNTAGIGATSAGSRLGSGGSSGGSVPGRPQAGTGPSKGSGGTNGGTLSSSAPVRGGTSTTVVSPSGGNASTIAGVSGKPSGGESVAGSIFAGSSGIAGSSGRTSASGGKGGTTGLGYGGAGGTSMPLAGASYASPM